MSKKSPSAGNVNAKMTRIPKQVTKLATRAQALREGTETFFFVNCLTGLKSLCRDPQIAARFVLYLAERTQEKMNTAARSKYISEADWTHYKALVAEAIAGMRNYLEVPNTDNLSILRDVLFRSIKMQDEYERQRCGPVRIIHSRDLLVVENVLRCIVSSDDAPYWAYQTARWYAQRYDPHYGTGLVPASAPLLEDIVRFWTEHQVHKGASEVNDE
jgi:hypothetical protein